MCSGVLPIEGNVFKAVVWWASPLIPFPWSCFYWDPSWSNYRLIVGSAWSALNKMMKVWKSNLKNHLKVGFFRATVESVLLYGAECWTMTGKMRNRLDGTYTRMLRAVLGVSWKEHKTNKELYGNLPKITDTLMIRRLRFIGHCWRKKDEVISDLLLWEPKHGARKRGRPATTYVDQLRNDTGLSIAELKNIMGNRKEWMKLVNGVRVRSK